MSTNEQRWRTFGTWYFAAQGASCIAWWAWMLLAPQHRGLFFPRASLPELMQSLIVGDLLLIAFGSLAAAHSLNHRRRWAPAAMWLVAGACMYAALLAISLWALTREAALAAIAMAPTLIIPMLLAWRIRCDDLSSPAPRRE